MSRSSWRRPTDPRDALTPAQQEVYDRTCDRGRDGTDLAVVLGHDTRVSPADRAAVERAFGG